MGGVKKSRRGVYYDLNASPYEYKSPCGDVFKFSSAKRLEIYSRDIPRELERLEKILGRYQIRESVPGEIVTLLERMVYKAFYNQVEK